MKISDEIVQEAVDAYYPVFTPNGEALEDMRRALSAVLPKLMVKVPELERYDYNPVDGDIYQDEEGEYVRYDQAAEMIAAKDAEIERLRDVAKKVIARWDSPHWKVTAPTADVMNELRDALSGKEPS